MLERSEASRIFKVYEDEILRLRLESDIMSSSLGVGRVRVVRIAGARKDNEPRKAMKRKRVSVLLAILFVSLLLPTSQQPKKIPRIGYLSVGNPTNESTRSEGIRLALRERGYIEGQNIATEYRYTEGKRDRQPELAAELVRLKVDIIIAIRRIRVDPGGRRLRHRTIPIVMVALGPILSR